MTADGLVGAPPYQVEGPAPGGIGKPGVVGGQRSRIGAEQTGKVSHVGCQMETVGDELRKDGQVIQPVGQGISDRPSERRRITQHIGIGKEEPVAGALPGAQ